MAWYYVENGEQRGPVTDADFEGLVQTGKVTEETLVWREGQPSWQAWREVRPKPSGGVPPGPAPGPTAPISGLICAECGKVFQPEQVIRLNDRWVCMTCKPVYLQRLQKGGGGPAGGTATEAQVRERDYQHDISDYLGRAWELFKSDVGGILGATLLVGLCLVSLSAVPQFLTIALRATGSVFLGVLLKACFSLASLVVSGPLIGGLLVFYLKKIRNEDAGVADAFSGFGPKFVQLMLGRIVPGLLAVVPVIPAAAVLLVLVLLGGVATGGHSAAGGPMIVGLIMVGGLLGLAGLCAAIYLQYCWMFTLWLVVDKNMGFWPAMGLSRAVVHKHWWQTLLLGIVSGLLVFAGFLCCCVGVFVTAPVAVGMWAYAYERLFGDMQAASPA